MERTSEKEWECLQRMEALVRRMAGQAEGRLPVSVLGDPEREEACEIVAELDKQSCSQYEETARLVWNDDPTLAIVPYGAKCIAKGRELALAEMKEAEAMFGKPMFIANVGKYENAEIHSVAELLRLINGGAKFAKIALVK